MIIGLDRVLESMTRGPGGVLPPAGKGGAEPASGPHAAPDVWTRIARNGHQASGCLAWAPPHLRRSRFPQPHFAFRPVAEVEGSVRAPDQVRAGQRPRRGLGEPSPRDIRRRAPRPQGRLRRILSLGRAPRRRARSQPSPPSSRGMRRLSTEPRTSATRSVSSSTSARRERRTLPPMPRPRDKSRGTRSPPPRTRTSRTSWRRLRTNTRRTTTAAGAP